MGDVLGLIFEGIGEILAHLEIESRPRYWFAIAFGVLAVGSLALGLGGMSDSSSRNALFTTSAAFGILAFVSLVVGHLFSDFEA